MIVVTGYLTIAPEHRATAEEAIATLVPLTEAEDGCLTYRYSADLLLPDRINIVEQWESEEAMTAHMGAAHFAEFMTAIGPCIGGDVNVVRHDVASSTKLF
ncbi:MAG TPA: putative quinol monooxygenase [Aquihabitans sp.]|nr:putative quinol monooxygenase [Aquihabitans sp.]